MEDAFRKAQEIITDRIRILEAQCNAFVIATAAENRSLKIQLQAYKGTDFEDEPHKQSNGACESGDGLAHTRGPDPKSYSAASTCIDIEANISHNRDTPGPDHTPAPTWQPLAHLPTECFETEESHQVSIDGLAHTRRPAQRSSSAANTCIDIETGIPQNMDTRAPDPDHVPAWQPLAHLAIECPEAEESHQMSIEDCRGALIGDELAISQSAGVCRTSLTQGVGADQIALSFDFQNSPSGKVKAVQNTKTSESKKSTYHRFFQQYLVRQIWWDHGFGNVCLENIVQRERAENLARTGKSIWTSGTHLTQTNIAVSYSVALPTAEHVPWFILRPDSMFRTVWVLICVVLLTYDIIMVPFVICFNPAESWISKMLVLMACIFWTVDIPLNFITGVRTIDGEEVRFQHIARLYAKSWFVFDVLLVIPEWVTLAIGNQFRSHSVFRLARWGRLTRLLRMARVMRLLNLQPLIRRIAYKYHLSKLYVVVTQGWIGTSILLVLFVHIISCFWYWFGNAFDNGWVEANGLSDADPGTSYVISTRWTLCRLQGLFSNFHLTSTADMLMDVFLILGTFMLASFYVSKMTAVTMTRVTDKCPSLWEKGIAFVRRHSVSEDLSFRLEKALEAVHYAGAIETALDEEVLLKALPSSLQQDLIYEARKNAVLSNRFFKILLSFNRQVTRHICNEAISLVIAVEEEVMFADADACHRMLFIHSGRSKYAYGLDGSYDYAQELEHGSFISEPVLWTTWEHRGHLKSAEESVMLALDSYNFADVVLQHKGPNMVAVRYAKHFVWRMNQAEDLHDMVAFPELTINELDTALFLGSDEDHFVFISHYKVEAGTEATLMRDLLVPILAEDRSNKANNFPSPIFIDSEDLSDLSRLKAHVVGSGSLVLLLTPGLLSRPWCLIEIVTALENDLNIVPVEVQRPGSLYRYPDEAFYASIREGRLLSQDAVELLATEGIDLPQVEAAIRKVFLKISCPFSPHKTKAIREAELDAIFKRCNGTTGLIIDPTISKSASASRGMHLRKRPSGGGFHGR